MISFGKTERATLKKLLQESLSIEDHAIADEIVSNIERDGCLRAFGFGSLINEPHTDDITKQYRANVPKWRRAFCVQDPYYRGTEAEPGIALGLASANENAVTPGAVLETMLDPKDMPTSMSRAQHWIKRFGDRENPKHSNCYKFQMVDTVDDHNKTAKAIACVANTASRYFIQDGFSLENKAAIIACSYGPTYRQRPSRTSLQYLRDTINDCRNLDLPLEDEFLQLLSMANLIRLSIPEENRAYLERLEIDKGYAEDLYDLVHNEDITKGQCGLSLAQSAWQTLGTLAS